MKTYKAILAAALLIVSTFAVADDRPPAGPLGGVITVPVGPKPQIARPIYQDSTLQGGTTFTFPGRVVIVPPVVTPDPCVTDPTSPGCGGGGTTDPPFDPPGGTCGQMCPSGGWYDSNKVCVKEMPICEPEPEEGHCGMPPNWGPNADPYCNKVAGGWDCYYPGTGKISYVCP